MNTRESEPNYDDSHRELGDDLSEYLQIYLDETDEQLDDLVETMLMLEKDPREAASLAAAFRLLHSMKGAAGMMGFDQITVLTHHLETRFERLRSGRIQLDRVTMSLTLRCIDFLRQCNQRLRADEALATPDVLLEELRELEDAAQKELEKEQTESEREPELEAAASSSDGGQPSDRNTSTKQQNDSPPSVNAYALPELGSDYHIVVKFQDQLMLKDLKAKSVATALGNLGEIKATRPDLDELSDAEDFDTFDVILNTTRSLEQMIEVSSIDGILEVEIRIPREPDREPLAISRPSDTLQRRLQQGASGKKSPNSIKLASPTVRDQTPDLDQAPAASTIDLGTSEGLPRKQIAAPDLETPATKKQVAKVAETMRVDIDRLDLLMNLAGELVVNRAQFLQVVSEISPGLRSSGGSSRLREFIELLKHTIDRLRTPSVDNGPTCSTDPLDWSANIRELEAGIAVIEDQAAQWEKSRRSLSHLDEAIDQLSRVSDSLQRGVLGARMVPVGPLLGRFKRVVRDLSMERDKDVILQIDGEATELDKRMVDSLGDPLVHLVRNSIDHGLERTDERIAAGKPAQGTIALSAKHRGNHVYIMISDDGGGINDRKIRQRLIDRGIVSADVAMSMSRTDAIDFIWHPGFSTAEAVTDVSGRGVGMDIVKSRIEELTGTIEVDSVLGQGTTITLKLPLTLAIISSLLVKIRGIVFAIPMDDVREIVSVADADVLTIRDKQAFEVRGQYLPLLSIDSLLTWSSAPVAASETSDASKTSCSSNVAVLQSTGRAIGLRVDELIGSQDVVIKSLSDHFIGIQGLAGASILGDGTVALMLDVAALLMMSVQPRQAIPTL